MNTRAFRWSMILGLAVVAGCDQPGGAAPRREVNPAGLGVNTDISVENPTRPDSPAPAAAPPPSKPILGAKTQDVKEDSKEANNGSVEKKPVIISKDPILLVGNAYVSIISRQATLNIQHALDLYKAETGDFPKTYDEFMEKIITANNIALPKLPSYQEYTYVVEEHRLAVREYPDRKAAMTTPNDKPAIDQ